MATHSFKCALASWLMRSKSWLLRLGLMARASSSSKISSPSWSSTQWASAGMRSVPDFLALGFGRTGVMVSTGAEAYSVIVGEEDADEVCDVVAVAVTASLPVAGRAEAGGDVIMEVLMWWTAYEKLPGVCVESTVVLRKTFFAGRRVVKLVMVAVECAVGCLLQFVVFAKVVVFVGLDGGYGLGLA